MKVYARHSLVGDELGAGEPALLLEGSWPCGDAPLRRSLDDAIDARHGWIDEEASRLAEQLAQVDLPGACGHGASVGLDRSPARPGPAYLNELRLRYYFVKLLRPVAFFEEAKPAGGAVDLIVARQRDEEYVELFASLAAAHDWRLTVTWRAVGSRTEACPPRNAWWRRAAAAVSSSTNPRWPRGGAPRVVLCGNRRLLSGVCGELVRRGARVAWLYDRFAVQTWLRWRPWGVAQLVCPASAGPRPPRPTTIDRSPLGTISSRGIDLTSAVTRWLAAVENQQSEHQARLWQNIDRHFVRVRPTLLVLDEDATPMARAAVAAARRHGVASVVIQHGVPRVKFGFAPLSADYFFAWGDVSRRQLLRWGVPLERVRVTGWPVGGLNRTANLPRATSNIERFEPSSRGYTLAPRRRRLEVLLFATTPPRDDRPDAVAFHLTDRTHRQMLRAALAAVAGFPGAWLTIKLHPRCRDDRVFREVAAEFPQLRCRIIRRGTVRQLTRRAACVLSCASGAGVEARQFGVKVIDLIPAGSVDLLPASQWGTLGTARTASELASLLQMALSDSVPRQASDDGPVFAAVGRDAARRVVNQLLQIQSSAIHAARRSAA